MCHKGLEDETRQRLRVQAMRVHGEIHIKGAKVPGNESSRKQKGKSSKSVKCAITGPCLRMHHSLQHSALYRFGRFANGSSREGAKVPCNFRSRERKGREAKGQGANWPEGSQRTNWPGNEKGQGAKWPRTRGERFRERVSQGLIGRFATGSEKASVPCYLYCSWVCLIG